MSKFTLNLEIINRFKTANKWRAHHLNMKQGSLLSFFKQRPAKPTGACLSSPAASVSEQKKISPKRKPENSCTPSNKATDAKTDSQATKKLKLQSPIGKPPLADQNGLEMVGKRLEVFWVNDDAWYKGAITAFADGKHTITYDDGDVEDVELKTQKFTLLAPEDQAKKTGGSPAASTPTQQRKTTSQKRKTVISDSESDEEAEFDDKTAKESSDEEFEMDEDEDSDDEEAELDPTDSDSDEDVSSTRRLQKGKKRRLQKRPKHTKSKTKSPSSKTASFMSFASSESKPKASTPKQTKPKAQSSRSTSSGSSFFKAPGSKKPSTPSSSSSPSAAIGGGTTAAKLADGVFGAGMHQHDEWKWLKDDVRDKKGRRPSDPDYDQRTLWVDPAEKKASTPAMQVWWGFKEENFDTVLFFKVGKFYELFHMDADVGYKELDLIYMKGYKAHSGFPEIGYGKYAERLVEKGYKVARVEQTETPDMLKARNDNRPKGKKMEKVVRRELCSILTQGTRTHNFLDNNNVMKDAKKLSDKAEQELGMVLLSVKERVLSVEEVQEALKLKGGSDGSSDASTFNAPWCEIGVCITDTATGEFKLGQFFDNSQFERLRTLLCVHSVVEVVFEKGRLSDEAMRVLKHFAPGNAQFYPLLPGAQFPDAAKATAWCKQREYFTDPQHGDADTVEHWPEALRHAQEGQPLAMSAFGASAVYLHQALIDHELISLKNVAHYVPELDSSGSSSGSIGSSRSSSGSMGSGGGVMRSRDPFGQKPSMVLDGITLANLELLQNNYDGKRKGSLIDFLDSCCTPFGRRKFQEWLSRPLYRKCDIDERLDAVDALMGLQEVTETLRMRTKGGSGKQPSLYNIPDMERLLSRVHSMGSKHLATDHPNARAIYYENYGKNKVSAFVKLMNGMACGINIMEYLEEFLPQIQSLSPLLAKLVTIRKGSKSAEDALFPDLKATLRDFERRFDAKKALDSGRIEPRPGTDESYDGALEQKAAIQQRLDRVLAETRREFGCSKIKFWGKGADRFQLEIPNDRTRGIDEDEYEVKSRTKTVKRYWTHSVKELLQEMLVAEAQEEHAKKDAMRKLFADFDAHYGEWMDAVQCIATLDCLVNLSAVSARTGEYCRPEFIEMSESQAPVLDIVGGRHPTVEAVIGADFIPNDLVLGRRAAAGAAGAAEADLMLLLAGPNMGGKSTMLRQACVIAIMAQIGCYVPADSCRLTPVDRVFTRLGASDRILQGQSTFFVELHETSTILHKATRSSLVILDELGRGTSTFDGMAIADAVVAEMVSKIQCRTLFATHYHKLIEEYGAHPGVQLGNMACMVESGNDRQVTFLYKLQEGPCSKSYGLNVARLAQLPTSVIDTAQRKADEFELDMKEREQGKDGSSAEQLVNAILAASAAGNVAELVILQEQAKEVLVQ